MPMQSNFCITFVTFRTNGFGHKYFKNQKDKNVSTIVRVGYNQYLTERDSFHTSHQRSMAYRSHVAR